MQVPEQARPCLLCGGATYEVSKPAWWRAESRLQECLEALQEYWALQDAQLRSLKDTQSRNLSGT